MMVLCIKYLTSLWILINFQLFLVSQAVEPTLCCVSTDYSTNYLTCSNGKDYNTAPISSCATCVSYQCIDWTFGSSANAAREAAFFAETGQNVYFGVASYSKANRIEAGLCYRITARNIDRDLIVQIVNRGSDVLDGNVDLQTGDGGFGLYNACTQETTKMPQFSGAASNWGATYGGVSTRAQCSNLPPYPICGSAPQDSMIELCQISFDKGLRNGNPVITAMCQVACPSGLVAATGLHRSDEKNSLYVCNNNYETAGGVVTKTMDCAKPSYGWADNVNGPTYPGYTAVIPCRRDGYTRVNMMSTTDTFGPSLRSSTSPNTVRTSTAVPSSLRGSATSSPTRNPSIRSTTRPTGDPSTRPTRNPSPRSSTRPTGDPSTRPTRVPSTRPSTRPTGDPSTRPTCIPSTRPSNKPVTDPSTRPSATPTVAPSIRPSSDPSTRPTRVPSTRPSTKPSNDPSTRPTCVLSTRPSTKPSNDPSTRPTFVPSTRPSTKPSNDPSTRPSTVPTVLPSTRPTHDPSTRPTFVPSTQPSTKPTGNPSTRPSKTPTVDPSPRPSRIPSTRPSTVVPTTKRTGVPSTRPTVAPSNEPVSST